MKIRPLASAVDREQIMVLLAKRGLFTVAELAVARELLDDVLTNAASDYQVLCAVDQGNTVRGYICFGRIPMTDRCYDLYWIAVDPDQSRQGMARFLLAHMEGVMRDQGGSRIYLDTSSTSPYQAAKSFYLKNGFTVECVLVDFYRPGDDKVIYKKDLDSCSG
jgi:ribosomal protein S18 acetylase RimI-like enzyme